MYIFCVIVLYVLKENLKTHTLLIALQFFSQLGTTGHLTSNDRKIKI